MPKNLQASSAVNTRIGAINRTRVSKISVQDGLSRAPPMGRGSVAIHPVLGDIDVEAAQIDGTKLVYPVVNFVKLVLLVRIPALLNQLLKPRRRPSIDQREIRHLVFGRIKVVEICQKDPQRVPNSAVGVRQLAEHRLAERDLVGIAMLLPPAAGARLNRPPPDFCICP